MAESVLIFGGTGDIASALARRLAAKGAALTLVARNEEKLNQLAGELGAQAIVADVTVASEVDQAFKASIAHHGKLTGVVNCVGSILLKPAHLTSDEEWHETLALNLHSSFYILRNAAKALRKEGGSIAFCSSAAAQIGLANHEAIAAAKGGLISLVKSAAATYAPAKIRVNAVAPGLVDTQLAKRITGNEASLKVSLGMHPLGRIGKPEDVASALDWLLDPEQGWVTGQILGLDGGLATLKNH